MGTELKADFLCGRRQVGFLPLSILNSSLNGDARVGGVSRHVKLPLLKGDKEESHSSQSVSFRNMGDFDPFLKFSSTHFWETLWLSCS